MGLFVPALAFLLSMPQFTNADWGVEHALVHHHKHKRNHHKTLKKFAEVAYLKSTL
jgi:hypothetical protein